MVLLSGQGLSLERYSRRNTHSGEDSSASNVREAIYFYAMRLRVPPPLRGASMITKKKETLAYKENNIRLKDQVAIITGVSHAGQVGHALTAAFAHEGALLAISSRSTER